MGPRLASLPHSTLTVSPEPGTTARQIFAGSRANRQEHVEVLWRRAGNIIQEAANGTAPRFPCLDLWDRAHSIAPGIRSIGQARTISPPRHITRASRPVRFSPCPGLRFKPPQGRQIDCCISELPREIRLERQTRSVKSVQSWKSVCCRIVKNMH